MTRSGRLGSYAPSVREFDKSSNSSRAGSRMTSGLNSSRGVGLSNGNGGSRMSGRFSASQPALDLTALDGDYNRSRSRRSRR